MTVIKQAVAGTLESSDLLVKVEPNGKGARNVAGEPDPISFAERIVGVVRYRDGSVIDVVRQVAA